MSPTSTRRRTAGSPAYATTSWAARSRCSALAERFMKHVKVPPMHYLAQWRMQLASTMLDGQAALAEIADAVGYGSEAAFSRAFKKTVGVAPAVWRATRR